MNLSTKMEKQNGICKFCGKEKKLIKAHIIPKKFYISNNYVAKDLSKGTTKRSQCGFYDTNILCSYCDSSIFGILDEYAIKIFLKGCTNFVEYYNDGENIIYHLEKTKFNYYNIRRFFVSVLWRASVSSIVECEKVSLGYYESIAKEIIEDRKQYDNLFKIQIFKIPNNRIISNTFYITKARIDNINSYKLYMANYIVYITINGENLSYKTKKIQEELFNKDGLYILESEEIYRRELINLRDIINVFEKIKKW